MGRSWNYLRQVRSLWQIWRLILQIHLRPTPLSGGRLAILLGIHIHQMWSRTRRHSECMLVLHCRKGCICRTRRSSLNWNPYSHSVCSRTRRPSLSDCWPSHGLPDLLLHQFDRRFDLRLNRNANGSCAVEESKMVPTSNSETWSQTNSLKKKHLQRKTNDTMASFFSSDVGKLLRFQTDTS